MKFWELVSVFRTDSKALKSLLATEQWRRYGGWLRKYDEHVGLQHREILDAVLPEELVEEAMRSCRLRFRVLSGLPGTYLVADENGELSALDVHRKYDGGVIEEVLEKSAWRVPDGPSEST